MSDQEQQLFMEAGFDQVKDERDSAMRQLLTESSKAQGLAAEVETLTAKLAKAELQIEEISKRNNVAYEDKLGAEDVAGDLKQFAFQVAILVGLKPGECTLAEVLHELKKKTKLSCHEEIGGSLLAKVKRKLDPQGKHATLMDAATALLDAISHSTPAIIARDHALLAGALKDERTIREEADALVATLRLELTRAVERKAGDNTYFDLFLDISAALKLGKRSSPDDVMTSLENLIEKGVDSNLKEIWEAAGEPASALPDVIRAMAAELAMRDADLERVQLAAKLSSELADAALAERKRRYRPPAPGTLHDMMPAGIR